MIDNEAPSAIRLALHDFYVTAGDFGLLAICIQRNPTPLPDERIHPVKTTVRSDLTIALHTDHLA
ncbi:hypothetical protein QCN27_14545 [Cereibacter sp. SYSU M97828]|nr:hypothetical protein [Cereibacter flavus]